MLIHLWNFLNLGQNLYQKLLMIIMVDVTWKSLKKKSHKIHMNETQIEISKTFSLGTQNLKNKRKSISEGLLRIRFIFYSSKVYNYHLVKG